MSRTHLVGNGVVVTGLSFAGVAKPEVISNGAVVWNGDRILAVGAESELRRMHPDAAVLDAHGGMILPGFINLHHHFYSALARGLDPGGPLRSFREILNSLWWRLDRALNPETVRLSAQLTVADCIRWGCTTVFDHHSSPSCISGSLDILGEVVQDAGMSAVLCYEVTDRNGHAEARAGIEENLRFLRQQRAHPRVRGLLGLHASFTLRDETLAEAAKRLPPDEGCHIHVGEDPIDLETSLRLFGAGPVERLERNGLLNRRSVLAHGIHLGPNDYARIARHESALIHNPESNANNRVGHLNATDAAGRGCLVGLGTDGMSSAMLRGLRAAFLAQRAAGSDMQPAQPVLPDLLHNNAVIARRFFDEPLLGELRPGAPADIAVLDAAPPTPICAENLFGHLAFGASEAPVRHTIARGQVLLEEFRHTTLDLEALAARAHRLVPGLWQRFHELKADTHFLGEG